MVLRQGSPADGDVSRPSHTGPLFSCWSLQFSDRGAEDRFMHFREASLVSGDARIFVPHVAVHTALLLRLLHKSRASLASVALCLLCTLSIMAGAFLSHRHKKLWARIREPFLAVGHVLYQAEGCTMLTSFAVVICQPALGMWAAAVLTAAVPWLLLDPLLMPIRYRWLRWVQPLSAAVLLPTNVVRCRLYTTQCAAAPSQFAVASHLLRLLGHVASPIAGLLEAPQSQCPCVSVLTYLQWSVGVALTLRLAKERERRMRLKFAECMGWHRLADQLALMEKPLVIQVVETLFWASLSWPFCQLLAALA